MEKTNTPEKPIWRTNGTYRTSPFPILPIPPPIDPEIRERARKAAMGEIKKNSLS